MCYISSLSKSYLIYLGGPHEIYFSTTLLTMTFQHLHNPLGLSRSFIKVCLPLFLAPQTCALSMRLTGADSVLFCTCPYDTFFDFPPLLELLISFLLYVVIPNSTFYFCKHTSPLSIRITCTFTSLLFFTA